MRALAFVGMVAALSLSACSSSSSPAPGAPPYPRYDGGAIAPGSCVWEPANDGQCATLYANGAYPHYVACEKPATQPGLCNGQPIDDPKIDYWCCQ